MSGRTFIDTNVLVYLFDEDQPDKRGRARLLIAETAQEATLSSQVLSEFFAVTTRKLSRPLTPAFAAAIIDSLAALPVVSVDADLVRAATRTARERTISFWDALIVEAALVAGCTRLYTEDLPDGTVIKGVVVENPFAA